MKKENIFLFENEKAASSLETIPFEMVSNIQSTQIEPDVFVIKFENLEILFLMSRQCSCQSTSI